VSPRSIFNRETAVIIWYIQFLDHPQPHIAVDFMGKTSFAGLIDGCNHELETHSLPDEMSERFDFFEIDADRVSYLTQHVSLPHRHEYQEVIWIRQGAADHLLDGESTGIPAGSLLVIPRGRMHRFMPSHNLTGCVVRFHDEFLPNSSPLLFSQFIGITNIPLPAEESAVIDSYFRLIDHEYRQCDGNQYRALRHLLRALLAKIEELRLRLIAMQPQALNQSESLWERFNIIIEENFKSEHSVSYYAGELGCSPRKLNAALKLFSGMTAAEAIDRRLILEAKRLILFSGLTIKEIAFDLGFEEHSYFTKVFKKLTGQTPSVFKESSTPA
jgi:AraC family transcriptional regulator, transcriptional activator of pobA